MDSDRTRIDEIIRGFKFSERCPIPLLKTESITESLTGLEGKTLFHYLAQVQEYLSPLGWGGCCNPKELQKS